MTARPSVSIAALTLVASLRAALVAARSVDDRRAGRTAAVERAREAAQALADARVRLESGLASLRVRIALGVPCDAAGRLVRAFSDRLLVADLAADLAEAHKHLLTLFPAVEAGVAEEARLAAAGAGRLAGAVRFDDQAPDFARQLERLLTSLPA